MRDNSCQKFIHRVFDDIHSIKMERREEMNSWGLARLLTVAETCEYLGLEESQFYRMIKKSSIEFKIKDGKKRILKSEAIAWRRKNPPRLKVIREWIKDIL